MAPRRPPTRQMHLASAIDQLGKAHRSLRLVDLRKVTPKSRQARYSALRTKIDELQAEALELLREDVPESVFRRSA